MITKRAASHQIMILRLARRSTIAPAGSEMKMKAVYVAAVSSPTSNADAFSTAMAVSGSASVVTAEPVWLTLWPAQNLMKSIWCHRVSGCVLCMPFDMLLLPVDSSHLTFA